MNVKILVLGSNGQLGRCLRDQFTEKNPNVVFLTREELDIQNTQCLRKKLLEFKPEVVVNTAAYTNVDASETNVKIANSLNHKAVFNLADICFEIDSLLIHISTDYVFDGNSKIPYKESDNVNPLSVYGRSKLDGENAIMTSNCNFIIIRTSWVFSEYGNNFLKTMFDLSSKLSEISIINDQIGCPTYAQDLAKTIRAIIADIGKTKKTKKTKKIFHYCGDNSCSWYEFAMYIFCTLKNNKLKTPDIINSVSSLNYNQAAKRPKNSSLDCSLIYRTFQIQPSDWRLGVKTSLNKILIPSKD